MKKKTAVLLALMSICLIGMAGIVAVSASDEPIADVVYEPIANVTADVTLSKINPDGTTTLVKTGNTSVKVTQNEDGTVNIEVDGSSTTTKQVDSLKPSESIEASARAVYYEASAKNYPMGYQCRICAYTPNMCVTGEAWAGHLRCYLC